MDLRLKDALQVLRNKVLACGLRHGGPQTSPQCEGTNPLLHLPSFPPAFNPNPPETCPVEMISRAGVQPVVPADSSIDVFAGINVDIIAL